MIVYTVDLILILFLGALCKPGTSQNHSKRYMLLVFLVLGLTSALRAYTVGTDTYQYWHAYNFVSYSESRYEYGFLFLIWLLNLVSTNPQTLIIFTSLFVCGSVCAFIYRYSENKIVSSYLFVTLLAYASYMNLMRQAVAVSVLLFMIPLLAKRRWLLYAAGVWLASQFHSSALVWLVLIPLSYVDYNSKALAGYIVAFMVAMLLPAGQLEGIVEKTLYGDYLASKWGGANALAAPVMALMDGLMLLFSFFCLKRGRSDKEDDQTSLMMHGASLLVLFQALAGRINIIQRIVSYFAPFLFVLVATAINRCDSQMKTLITYLILCLTTLFFFVVLIYRPEWQGIVPYRPFWAV